MKDKNNILQIAWCTEQSARSMKPGKTHPLGVFVFNIRHKIARHQTQDWGILPMINDQRSKSESRVAGWTVTNVCPVTSDFKTTYPSGKPETLNLPDYVQAGFKLVTKMPLQATLHGSKYKSLSCLPRDGFNSGVCPGAAAITKRRSKFSSPRATLPGEWVHPKYLTGPTTSCINNTEPGHNDREGMPM